MPRRFPIFQFPNRPLIVTLVAGALARMTGGPARAAATLLARLALLVWSAEEIARGANWFRRLLGLAGASYVLTAPARGGGTRSGASTSAGSPRRRRSGPPPRRSPTSPV
jgi:hypothetical protein